MTLRLQKPPLIAAIMALCGIAVLCTLGMWQIKRLTWKTGLLTQIEKEQSKNAQTLPLSPQSLKNINDSTFYRQGRINGKFLYEKQFLLGPKAKDGQFANLVVTPMKLSDSSHILVVRGWIPQGKKLKDLAEKNQKHWVSGYLKTPSHNMFLTKNKPSSGKWQQINIKQAAGFLKIKNLLPIVMYAENASYERNEWPKPGTYYTAPQPNNNHLQYALFWFSLAGILSIIFTLRFCIKQENA